MLPYNCIHVLPTWTPYVAYPVIIIYEVQGGQDLIFYYE